MARGDLLSGVSRPGSRTCQHPNAELTRAAPLNASPPAGRGPLLFEEQGLPPSKRVCGFLFLFKDWSLAEKQATSSGYT